MSLNNDLETVRVRLGLTQAELAHAIGTSQTTICNVLSGRQIPRPALLQRLQAFLASAATGSPPSDEWMAMVELAARKSPEFRAVVDGALGLMNNNE